MTNISRRSALVGAGTLAALLASPRFLTARASDGPFTVRAVQPWEFNSIQPAEGGFVINRASVSEGLVALHIDGSVIPCLATSWTAEEGGRVWRFVLRQGVVFHDGTPMTAENARDSIEKLIPTSSQIKAAGIESVAVDGNELVFTLKAPFSPFPAYMCDYALGVYAPAAFAEDGTIRELIATGPFSVEAVEVPRLLKLARHEAYWGEVPVVERAEFETVISGETRANIALAGDADVVMNIPVPSMSRIAGSGIMNVHEVLNPRVHRLYPNCARPQFADARVRRALTMAIDRKAIATTIMRNPELTATQHFPPVMPEWHFDDLPNYDFDPAAAEALLDEAGWIKGADGIRSKDGVRFAGTIRTFPNRPEMPVIASALQAMFKAVGFELEISVGDAARIVEGKQDDTLDIALSSRNLAVIPDGIACISSDFVMETAMRSADGVTNWESAALNALIARYFTEVDDASRAATRREIVTLLHDETPVIPLVWYSQIFAVSNAVEGFVNDPYEQRLYLDRLKPVA